MRRDEPSAAFPPLAASAMLLDAMLMLARRGPLPESRKSDVVDGARHAMIGIFAGMQTGGLTRYPFPPPRFELVDGTYADRTYEPPEKSFSMARQNSMARNFGGPKQ